MVIRLMSKIRWKLFWFWYDLKLRYIGNYRVGYMCAIDFDHELGEAWGGSKIYSSLDDLKEHHHCWEGCGIVKVKIYHNKTVVPQNLMHGQKDDN